jgi:hypothetical protein
VEWENIKQNKAKAVKARVDSLSDNEEDFDEERTNELFDCQTN